MMTIGPLEEGILSPELLEYSRICGMHVDCISTPVKPPPDSVIHFKILVPGVAAGAIIGKGGETIAQLQKDAGARVKMSKANDFYPGTSERVCLITGCLEAILYVLRFVQEKIREKPDMNAKPAIDYDSKVIVDRDRQVKILVPNSTAGMVIGKGGSYIKLVKEESAAYVQISQKAKDQTLTERCITVIGDGDSCRRACLLILQKISEDPQSGSCLNVSYADVHGPVANFNPTGSPFAVNGAAAAGYSPTNTSINSSSDVDCFNPAQTVLPNGLRLELRPQSVHSTGHNLSPHALDHIHNTLRASGYSEQAANEVTAAIDTLARYGIMGVSVAPPTSPVMHGHGSALSPLTGGAAMLHHHAGGAVPDLLSPHNHLPALPHPLHPHHYLHNSHHQQHQPSEVGYMSPLTAAALHATQSCAQGSSGGASPVRPGDSPPFLPFSGSGSAVAALPVNNNSYGLGTLASLPPASPAPSPPPPSCSSPPPTPQQCGGGGASPLLHSVNGPHVHLMQNGVGCHDPDMHRFDMEVGEYIIGAILGPGGRDLAEIQRLSGAIIQISRKGTFRPGTRNRVVSLSGSPQAVSTAQYLVEQKISEEEAKRARQPPQSQLTIH